MRCAKFGEPAPAPLLLAWQCARYHALPDNGGVLEQDYATMQAMIICVNVFDAVTKLVNAHGDQIHQLTDGERRVLRTLLDLGILNG